MHKNLINNHFSDVHYFRIRPRSGLAEQPKAVARILSKIFLMNNFKK